MPLTPRQIPIEVCRPSAQHAHALLRNLTDLDDLVLLPTHPPRIHFSYLDPNYRASGLRRHDSATVGDPTVLAYTPAVVVISENKDTAIHFPELKGGIAVEGVGRGGTTAATFSWITGTDSVFYWGDMDADGLEILDGFRAAGIPARSLLMSWSAYERWERFGTNVDQHGKPLLPPGASSHSAPVTWGTGSVRGSLLGRLDPESTSRAGASAAERSGLCSPAGNQARTFGRLTTDSAHSAPSDRGRHRNTPCFFYCRNC